MATSSSTKVIGVRVPLHEYMEILQTAADNKMTISDYALQLIYLNKAKPQGQIGLELERKCSVLKQDNTDLKGEVESLTKSLKKSETELEQANSRLTNARNKIRELEKKLDELQSEHSVEKENMTANNNLKNSYDQRGKNLKVLCDFIKRNTHDSNLYTTEIVNIIASLDKP